MRPKELAVVSLNVALALVVTSLSGKLNTMIMGRLGDQECTLMEHQYGLGVVVWKPIT
jgi:hypothetical protein